MDKTARLHGIWHDVMMLVGGLVAGGVMAHYATKDRYKSMAREQEQQE
jgi:uncharacterized membrane protein YebE (DUF533 family)